MNQSTSGELSYTEKKIKGFIAKLEEQYNAFKLDSVIPDITVPTYLNVCDEQIYKMSPEDLRLAELKISAYAFCIQKHINRATAIKNYAQKLLGMVVASKHREYSPYVKYDVMEKDIIRTDIYAKKIDEIMEEQQMKIDEFNFLSQSLNKVAESFGKIATSRRKDVT